MRILAVVAVRTTALVEVMTLFGLVKRVAGSRRRPAHRVMSVVLSVFTLDLGPRCAAILACWLIWTRLRVVVARVLLLLRRVLLVALLLLLVLLVGVVWIVWHGIVVLVSIALLLLRRIRREVWLRGRKVGRGSRII